jgi:hypothetical protein
LNCILKEIYKKMEIKGKVFSVGKTETVTEKFKKRELILEYAENPEYVEYIKLEATQNKVDLLDTVRVGDEVEVSFNLKGRGWKDKTGKQNYTINLVIWKLVKSTGAYANQLTEVNHSHEDSGLPF